MKPVWERVFEIERTRCKQNIMHEKCRHSDLNQHSQFGPLGIKLSWIYWADEAIAGRSKDGSNFSGLIPTILRKKITLKSARIFKA